MTIKFKLILFILLSLYTSLQANDPAIKGIDESSKKPLVERFILDELRSLRIENMQVKNDLEKRLARAEIKQTDRAARYMTDTIGNIFYLIAAATSILIFA